ncbi:procathepsin L-like [Bacillus rossius redtenbacheri]|uniref:procathepsin L-like n=1 Tax=Bacillus rossius redtenbacheri TaxID=93214 RepID=UPI002FDEF425
MEKKMLVILSSLLFTCLADSFSDVILQEWETFKIQHGKTYVTNVEEKFRLKIFMENKRKIARHNARYERGEVTFTLGMNEYGDLLPHEFARALNGFNRTGAGGARSEDGVAFIAPGLGELPRSVDWRRRGAVTPVKNQGDCGACWAFSATGSLEGQHFRKTKKLVSLSEQNLIDCSGQYGNNGCEGGLMDYAFQYIKANRGIDTEKYYPYKATDGSCRYNPKDKGATDKGFVDLESGSEEQLQQAVAAVGPVSVAIDASRSSFQLYKDGVYFEPDCSSAQLDHGVLVVGYGGEEDSQFWIVKNSWGRSWGKKGYILMSRNRDNNCGIATCASYPLV